MTQLIDPNEFTSAVTKLRNFFTLKGYLEVHTQNRLSILAACEDPTTVSTYEYAGNVWPLPQTGQMWLEYELLTKPELNGVFCVSTSYRQEPNPIPGRHDLIFPMFEFEGKGTINELRELELELCEYLGFADSVDVPMVEYEELMEYYDTPTLEAEHEDLMWSDYGDVVLLQHFPYHTSPFWNMKKVGDTANKIDVIICGQETIGSAERASDVAEMRHQFHTISDGLYADLLYSKFSKERVETELEDFLSLDFFPRFGGGIGMTRMISALKLRNLL